MEPMNFSKGLLENFSVVHTSRLMVLSVRDVYWSDWGSEQRILRGLKMAGSQEPRRGAKENKSRKLAEGNSEESCSSVRGVHRIRRRLSY
jgi:hypothetical protein